MALRDSDLSHDVDGHEPPLPPRIAAAFYVVFDARKGYTIAWQRAEYGLQLNGVVEYKSFPSGLHNVEEDLVYFVHEDYGGISAFLNQKDTSVERNARMLAVGVLVPLDQGRMGKSWRHAETLKELARKLTERPDEFDLIERYWNDHRLSNEQESDDGAQMDASMVIVDDDEDDQTQLNGQRSARRLSTTSGLNGPSHAMSSHHPALSLAGMLHVFGPLLFPLYRAALLRKRILFLTEAPVELACDYVYDVSVLSSLPASLTNLLPMDETPNLRLKALFNVGVPDILQLSSERQPSEGTDSDRGWIACTTDDVLATKPELFNLLVMLPSADARRANPKAHPKLVLSSPELSKTFAKTGIRATQRDARQHLRLWSGLTQIPSAIENQASETAVEDDTAESTHSTAPSTFSHKSIVEPQSWSHVAYTSLIWWASAGENRLGMLEEEESEAEQDAQLLNVHEDDEHLTKEVAIVAYFHRLTTTIFSTVSDAIARTDREDYHDDADGEDNAEHDQQATDVTSASTDDLLIHEFTTSPEEHEEPLLPTQSQPEPSASAPESPTKPSTGTKPNPTERQEYEPEPIEITEDDMRGMALDIWSARDREFVEDLVWLWWGRKVDVRGGRVECCGVRIL